MVVDDAPLAHGVSGARRGVAAIEWRGICSTRCHLDAEQDVDAPRLDALPRDVMDRWRTASPSKCSPRPRRGPRVRAGCPRRSAARRERSRVSTVARLAAGSAARSPWSPDVTSPRKLRDTPDTHLRATAPVSKSNLPSTILPSTIHGTDPSARHRGSRQNEFPGRRSAAPRVRPPPHLVQRGDHVEDPAQHHVGGLLIGDVVCAGNVWSVVDVAGTEQIADVIPQVALMAI